MDDKNIRDSGSPDKNNKSHPQIPQNSEDVPQDDENRQGDSGNRLPLAIIIAALVALAAFSIPAAFDRTGALAIFFLPLSAALFAFLFTLTRSPYVFLTALIAYVAALALSRDPLASMLAAGFLPPGFAIAAFSPKKEGRNSTVVRASAFIAVSYILYVIFCSFIISGSLTSDSIIGFFNPQLAFVRGVLSNASLTDGENIVYLYTAEQVELLINYLYLIAPAMLIIITNVIAYIASAVYFRIMCFFRVGSVVSSDVEPGWKLNLSIVSAYIFCAAYVISVLFSGGLTAANIVATNVMLILTPGFSLVGMRFTFAKLKGKYGVGVTVVLGVAVFLLLLISAPMVFTILSFVGVAETIITNFKINRKPAD